MIVDVTLEVSEGVASLIASGKLPKGGLNQQLYSLPYGILSKARTSPEQYGSSFIAPFMNHENRGMMSSKKD